ncbi:MAG: hypothetical protein MUF03_00280 [Rubrivivax sp.]|jgi:hypothetical protein|nr:hypothetical protein [Rubrivivax sp.]
MHDAPAVRWAGPVDPTWHALQIVLPALAAAAIAAWVAGHAGIGAAASLALSATAAVAIALVARRSAAVSPSSLDLAWDGAAWLVDGIPGQARVEIDLGGWMLLRWRPGAARQRARWIAVSRRAAGPAWHALRVALFARAAGAGSARLGRSRAAASGVGQAR